MDVIRGNLEIVLKGLEANALKSAEAVMKDLGGVDGSISHFLDDVEAKGSRPNSQVARRNIGSQGGKNVELLRKIKIINKQASNLDRELPDLSQLKLKRRSFTAPASSTAEEVTRKDLLDKLSTWPGPDLRRKLGSLFDYAMPEDGSEDFKRASKEVLLALAEQESILNLISNELLDTIESEKDRRKLQSLRNSAEELLSAFRVPDSPFTRLRNLALAGYHWPADTASVARNLNQFLAKIPTGLPPQLPVNVQPGAGNGPPAGANVQLPLGKGQPVPASVQVPAAVNAQQSVIAGPSTVRALPSTPVKAPPVSGNGQAVPGGMPAAGSSASPLSGAVSPGNPGHAMNLSPVPGSVQQPSNLAQPATSGVQPGLANLPPIPNGPPPPLPVGTQPDLPNLPPVLNVPPPPLHLNVSAAGSAVVPAELPPPNNLGQASQPANLVPAGGQPQPNASNVMPPSGLPAADPSASLQANIPAMPDGLSLASPGGQLPAAVPPPGGWPENVSPPPDDTPPPPSNVGQASPPANNVVAAGAQPQSSSSNVTLASGLQPNAPSLTHATPAISGAFVKKRVGEYSGKSPLIASNTLPKAKVVDGDLSVPPPDYMPAPPEASEPANPPQEASGQLNSLEKSAAAMLSAALDMTPPPEEPPPPLPSNLSPPVLNGVMVPLKDVPLGGVGKAEAGEASQSDARVRAAVARTLGVPDVPQAPGDIARFPTTAAKLLADLASSDHLTASKNDDGTGHRVVTKKGKVLFLKASSTQEEVGLRSLVNGLLGRRDAQTKKALAALLDDAELRGLTSNEDGNPGHAGPMIKHALELGKNGVKFDNFVRKNVETILAEDVKRQLDVAERQDRISRLFLQSKEPQIKSPEAAIDEFCASNGSDFEKDNKALFLKELGGRVGVSKPSAHTIDESSLSSVDQWNYELIKSVDYFTGLTQQVKKMTTAREHLKEGDDFYILPPSFAGETRSFLENNMPGDVGIFTQNVLVESTVVFAQGLISQSIMLMNVVYKNDLVEFKGGMAEIKWICEKAFRQLEALSRLFTNQQYLAQVPIEALDLLTRYGKAMQEIALGVLDPKGPYIAFYRMAEAAGISPETAMDYFRKALRLTEDEEPSDGVQAGESKPPSKPLPPIPTGVPLDQKLGPPPLPTSVASGSQLSNAAQTP
ncbi:hypothetical protein [Variovorax sp. DT-64]|uniref:hypothetical protein n=1 Tax=Variovorax sp. DT-64 TaxID=3396160 RepID=UPI003F19B29A